jgi:hypothetical protein
MSAEEFAKHVSNIEWTDKVEYERGGKRGRKREKRKT